MPAEENSAGSARTTAAAATTASAGRTLLVVDDDEGVREALWILFRDSCEVILAENGRRAIEIASGREIDAVILDIRMPGMTGIAVLSKLKEIDPATEVIMLTAHETLETARDALRLGACDYLSKPYSIDGMREVVSRALSRRAVSREIRSHDRKLRELQREIHDRQLREELARTHAEIYASILHDINGPLTVIRGFIDKLRHELVAARVDATGQANMRQQANGIDHQVLHCLDISRRYLGFLEGRTHADAPVPMNDVLADLKELLEVHPNARLNQLHIEPLAQNITPTVHPTDLLSILLNLTINALQSSSEPHRVEVKGRLVARIPDHENKPNEQFLAQPRPERQPALAITVQDNGPGMAQEVLEMAFQPHFTTKGPGRGFGLGLSIVRRLVAQANGAIHLYSRPGEGTIFTVYLPAKF
jgi:two-component system sensor histidine kinase/response regulator